MTTPSIKRRYKALPTMHCLVWNFLSCRAIVMKVRKKEKKKRSMSQLLSKTLSAMQFFLFYFIFFFLERKAMWMQKIFFMAFLGHFFVFFLLCGQHFDFIFWQLKNNKISKILKIFGKKPNVIKSNFLKLCAGTFFFHGQMKHVKKCKIGISSFN